MIQLIRFEEEYAAYLKKRAQIDAKCTKGMILWAALLAPAFVFALWILWNLEWWSGGGQILGHFTLMFLAIWAIYMPRGVLGSRKSRVDRLTYELSVRFMTQALEVALGGGTHLAVKTNVNSAAGVARHQRLAWLKPGEEFLIHRVRVTGEDSDGYTYTVFDGTAFSVPVDPVRWGARGNKKEYKKMAAAWGDRLCIDGREPEFSLDRFENKLWLSAAYAKLKLGERDIPWRNLEQWCAHCESDVQRIKHIRDELYKIAAEG